MTFFRSVAVNFLRLNNLLATLLMMSALAAIIGIASPQPPPPPLRNTDKRCPLKLLLPFFMQIVSDAGALWGNRPSFAVRDNSERKQK